MDYHSRKHIQVLFVFGNLFLEIGIELLQQGEMLLDVCVQNVGDKVLSEGPPFFGGEILYEVVFRFAQEFK